MLDCDFDLVINGVQIDGQPFAVQYIPSQLALEQVSGGGYTAWQRSKGARVVMRWGPSAVSIDTLAELRQALGSSPAGSVAFTENDGTAHSLSVIFEPLTVTIEARRTFYQPFTLTAFERP